MCAHPAIIGDKIRLKWDKEAVMAKLTRDHDFVGLLLRIKPKGPFRYG